MVLIRSWDNPIEEPAWTFERELKGLLRTAQLHICVQSQENSRLRDSSLDETKSSKAERECCRPVAQGGIIAFESWSCKHMREKQKMYLCVPSSPQAPAASIPGYAQLVCFGS